MTFSLACSSPPIPHMGTSSRLLSPVLHDRPFFTHFPLVTTFQQAESRGFPTFQLRACGGLCRYFLLVGYSCRMSAFAKTLAETREMIATSHERTTGQKDTCYKEMPNVVCQLCHSQLQFKVCFFFFSYRLEGLKHVPPRDEALEREAFRLRPREL